MTFSTGTSSEGIQECSIVIAHLILISQGSSIILQQTVEQQLPPPASPYSISTAYSASEEKKTYGKSVNLSITANLFLDSSDSGALPGLSTTTA
jgi:hypothetical protein